MRMVKATAPPQWILFLLWPFKGESCYPQIEGDLSEEFQQQESIHGIAVARQWYYREACRNLWSMIWRWTTIAAISVPLVGFTLGDYIRHLFLSTSNLWHWFILGIIVDSLFTSSLIGLALGIVCSRLLKKHERLVRLAFGVYQLGYLLMIIIGGVGVLGPSFAARVFLIGLICLRPIWTLIFFCMGSIWIERRYQSGHRAA
jgi:hypothetical protein